ncbi:hypothetical protein ACSBR2_011604 [Camellia fascicularis]
MDLPSEELQFLSIPDILRESTSFPKQSPKTFCLLTLTLIFPLAFTILAHSLFTYPLLTQIDSPTGSHSSQWTKLLIFQFFYLIFLFAFSLLPTVVVVFTVVSLYTSNPSLSPLPSLPFPVFSANVVSVLEPVFRFTTMEKSYELLKGRTRMAVVLVFGYLAICGVNNGVFGVVVVHGEGYGIFVRIMIVVTVIVIVVEEDAAAQA